jgi:hypothetical protein
MDTLFALWLPILLSAVVVFVVSSLIHMVFKWHASDYRGLPNEEAVREVIRAAKPTPGLYAVPYCSDMKDMGSEAMARKYREGPVAHLHVGPSGVPNMGKYLGLWFLWGLVIAAVTGFLVGAFLGVSHGQALVAAQLTAALTFVAHGFGTVTESIWMLRTWSASLKNLLDAALYAVGTGLVFFWLWP